MNLVCCIGFVGWFYNVVKVADFYVIVWRPMEASCKKPVGRFREVIQAPKKVSVIDIYVNY